MRSAGAIDFDVDELELLILLEGLAGVVDCVVVILGFETSGEVKYLKSASG